MTQATNHATAPAKAEASGRRVAPDLVALGLILALGVALRVYYLFSESMRGDEAFTFNEYASKPIEDVFTYTFPNNHVLYTLIVHLAVGVLGPEPWVVRLPALVAGVLMIPATYALVRRLADRAAGVLAAALVGSSTVLVSYSANGRGYTLLGLIAVLLALMAARLVEGGRLGDWAAFVVLTPLGFLTIPTMLYSFGGILVWMIGSAAVAWVRGRPTLRLDRLACALLLAAGLTVLLYLPVLSRSGLASIVANRFVAPRPPAEVARELPRSLYEVWLQWNLDVPRALAVGLAGAWGVGLIRLAAGKGGAGRISALTLVVFGWTLAVVLYQRVVPFDRVWLFLLPFYAGCVASGVGGLLGGTEPRRVAVASTLAVAFCVAEAGLVLANRSIPSETEKLTLNHGMQIARELKARLRPGDAVVAELPCEAPLKYDLILAGVPTEVLYDYRVAAARRVYIAVNRPNGQDAESVLRWNRVAVPTATRPRLVEDYGQSSLYVLDRATTAEPAR